MEPLHMTDTFAAIRTAVQEIRDAEEQNLAGGVHLLPPEDPRWQAVYDRRWNRMVGLRELLFGPGIQAAARAGLREEPVINRIICLYNAAMALVNWENPALARRVIKVHNNSCSPCEHPFLSRFEVDLDGEPVARLAALLANLELHLGGVMALNVAKGGHVPEGPKAPRIVGAVYFPPNPSKPDLLARQEVPPGGCEAAPAEYLWNWREILDALDLKNNAASQGKVREANQRYDGPISLPGKGGQPKVSKAKLLEWWNGLEIQFLTGGAGANAQATLAARHNCGRDGTVLPDIGGHLKKRRSR
jgi:hypothetical protein